MLSLSSYPYHVPFCRSQNGSDGFLPSWLPPVGDTNSNNPSYVGNWFAKEPLPLTNAPEANSPQNESSNPTSEMSNPLVKTEVAVSDSSKVPCLTYPQSMNGELMTGSSNPRAEQLSWLAEVATGSVRASQTASPVSPSRDKDNGPLLHPSENTIPRNSLNPILLGVNPLNPQRMYASYHGGEGFHPTQQVPGGGGGGISLYYSQASRPAPYQSFYHAEHRLPYNQVVTDGFMGQSRLARPYYHPQGEIFAPTMVPLNHHGSLPHSPSYLHPNSSMSPVGMPSSPSSPHARMTVQQQQIVSQEHENRSISNSPQFQDPRKTYKSPEPKNRNSPSCEVPPKEGPSIRNCSPSHLAYKVPTGKEGSLKHRILRLPSINIVDPPPSTLHDAPLSAPPIRSPPKVTRQDSYYRSMSTSGPFGLMEGPHVLSQSKLPMGPSFVVPSSNCSSASSPDVSSNLMYPPAFMKGSIIQLANSQLKPVELMTTEDFVECESLSSNLKIDSSSVISIEKMPSSGSAKLGFSVGQNKLQITVEAPLEHPFFVFKHGWSSCCPQRSLLRYGLACNKLKVGDTCIFLTVKSDQAISQTTQRTTTVPTQPSAAKSKNEPPQSECQDIANNPVPSQLQNAGNAKVETGAPRKRKRRWSAPCEVTAGADLAGE